MPSARSSALKTNNYSAARKLSGRLLTISEAAKFLNVSSETLRYWEKQGRLLPIRQAGSIRRYSLTELKQYLKYNPQFAQRAAKQTPSQVVEEQIIPETIKEVLEDHATLPAASPVLEKSVEITPQPEIEVTEVPVIKEALDSVIEEKSLVQRSKPSAPKTEPEIINITYSSPLFLPHQKLPSNLFKQTFKVYSGIAAVITMAIIAGYLTQPQSTKQMFGAKAIDDKTKIASSEQVLGVESTSSPNIFQSALGTLLSPFNFFAQRAIEIAMPNKAQELGFIPPSTQLLPSPTNEELEQLNQKNEQLGSQLIALADHLNNLSIPPAVDPNQQTTAFNLLRNSSFEANSTGQPTDWFYSSESTSDNTFVNNGAVRTGNRSLRIEPKSGKSQFGIYQPYFETQANRIYTLSFYINNQTNQTLTARVSFWDKNNNTRALTQDFPVSTTSGWQRMHLSLDPPNQNITGHQFYPMIEILGATQGNIFIDDIDLSEGSTMSVYNQEGKLLGDGSIRVDEQGNVYPNTSRTGSIGIDQNRFKSLYLEGASIDSSGNASFNGTLTALGQTTFNGTINFSGGIGSSLIPTTDNAYNLGSSSSRFASAFIGTDLRVDGNTILGDTSVDTIAANGRFTTALIPATSNTYDLGNATNLWANAYLAGDIAINGGDLTSSSAVFNLLTANVTTLNIGTSATSVNIGAATGTSTINNNLTISGTTGVSVTGNDADLGFSGTGNHDITASSGTLRIGAFTSTGAISASTGGIDIGSVGTRFSTIYADTGNFTNLVAASTTIGGTDSDSFILNADNATADTENAYLYFERGSTAPNALFGWDAASDLFSLNSSLTISPTISTTTGLTIGGFTTGLSFNSTSTTTDISLQNGETIDNNTDGTITLTASNTSLSGNLLVTGASTVTLGGGSTTSLSLTDDNWSVNAAGAGTFASMSAGSGAVSGGAATFSSLTVTANTDLRGDLADSTGNLTLNDSVDIAAALTVGGGYGSTGVTISTTGDIQANGNLTVDGFTASSGNITLGDASSDTITFNGVVNSTITPSSDNAYNLGSASRQWANVYAVNGIFSNLVSTSTEIGGTKAATFSINTDNATSNAEIASIAFEQGSSNFNAILQWNASGDTGNKVSGYDNYLLANYPLAVFSEVSGANQTFTSGSLFKYGQNAAHAITQSAAFIGTDIDFSSNITVPNTSSGNQTGSKVTLKDGGASATAIGFQTAGTLDYGLDIGGTVGTADIRLSNGETIANTTDGTVAITATTTSLSAALSVAGTSTLTGNTTVGGTLGVTGATTLSSTLAVTGAATFSSTIASGAITSTGTSAFDALTVGGGYGSTGVTISSAGAISANSTLTVDSTSTLTGLVTASGGILINGGSFAAGRIYKDSGLGTVIAAQSGTSYDFVLTSAAGSDVLRVPTGTNNLRVVNGLTVDAGGATITAGGLQVTAGNIGIGGAPVASRLINWGGSLTAGSGSAYGILINGTMNASANGDTLYGQRIVPLASVGAFTGTTQYGLYIDTPTGAATNIGLYNAGTTTLVGDTTHTGNIHITNRGSVRSSTDGVLQISADINNAFANSSISFDVDGTSEATLTSSAFSPATTDSNALGTSSLMWSDLFLASGAVTNYNNGDVTITHSANTLAFAGASTGYTFDSTTTFTDNSSNGGIIVQGSTNPRLRIIDSTASHEGNIQVQDTKVWVGSPTSTPLYLTTSNTERLGIDANGAVTINAPSSGTGLTVAGGGATITAGNLGIGSTPAAQFGAYLTGSILTTQTTQAGVYSDATTSSAATVAGIGGYFRISTPATAFTMTNAYGIEIGNPGKGAGSTITTATGLYVNTMTQGGTNNYGVYINAPSGGSTNNIGLYNAGSAVVAAAVTIDPDSFSSAILAGNIADGSGWATYGLGFGQSTGQKGAIGASSGSMYLGMQDGSTNNSMTTWIQHVGSTRYTSFPTGQVGIGDTSNANMNQGLTINQGANDNEIFALKSSDIAHGTTGIAEADTYAFLRKYSATSGGLEIVAPVEESAVTQGLRLYTFTTGDTTKTATSVGAIQLWSALATGTGGGQFTDNGNLVVIGHNSTNKFIFDEDGEMFAHGTIYPGNLSAIQTTSYLSGDADGIGIGTTNPSSPLHIISGASADILNLNNTATGYGPIIRMDASTGGAGGRIYRIMSGGSGNGAVGSGKFGIWDETANAGRLVIDTGGNVGIGTVTPTALLDVQGSLFWKGTNVASAANSATVTEVSGNYPANNTSPYTTDAGSIAAWGSSNAIDGATTANDQTAVWIDAGGEGGVTFIKVVFNNTYVIDRVRLAGRYDASTLDGQPQEFQLDFSDGTVQTFTFPSSYTGMQEYNIQPVATSFIRYTTRSKYSTGNNGLREIEAYTRYAATNGTLANARNIFYSNAKGTNLNGNVGIGTTGPTSSLNTLNKLVDLAGGALTGYVLHSTSTAQESSYATDGSGLYIEVGGHATATNNNIIFRTEETNSQFSATERMRITSSGNVGIGITAPVNLLDIQGTTRTGTHPTGQQLYVTGNMNTGDAGPGTGNIEFRHTNASQGIGFGYNTIYATGDATNQVLNIQSKGSSPLTLNAYGYSTGNVGIGTTTPANKLHVVGGIMSAGALTAAAADSTALSQESGFSRWIAFGPNATTAGAWRILVSESDGGGQLTSLAGDLGGNVGIGAADPARQLELRGTSDALFRMRRAANTNLASLELTTGATQDWLVGTRDQTNSDFAIYSFGTAANALTILRASGNVGIGTATPAQKLDIVGGLKLFGGSYAVQKFQETRSLGGTAGDTTQIGTFAVTGTGSFTKFFITAHNCDTITQTEFETWDNHYAGATTDWVELPTVRGNNYDGTQTEAIDVRKQSNASVLEARLRNKGGACGAGNVYINIESNSPTYTASSTTGSGGTVATGYFASNVGYKFPVSTNRFTASTSGLFINNDGNVGIGTTAPAQLLDVFSTSSRLTVSTAGRVTVPTTGSSAGIVLGATNTVTLVDDATVAERAGTARRTYKLNLVPEFEGATLTGDGADNTGDMTSDFCSEDGRRNINSATTPTNALPCDNDVAGEEHNYYSWTTTSGSAQDYDIWVRYQLPSDFSAWAASNPVKAYGWRTDATANLVNVSVFDTSGVVDANANATSVATGTLAWTQTNVATSLAGTYAADGFITFKIKMTADTSDSVKIGEIELNYLSKFK